MYDLYDATKGLRSSETNKRLRRLCAFERTYYKKTYEVKKIGHGLEDEHRLNDGNLRYSSRNLTYSLNKKKRWLLPDIIEQRICEYDPNSKVSKTNKHDQTSSIDERLKIVMYENENIRHKSTCIRYGNSQIEPHIIHKNGRRFNSDTLTKWMDFNTRDRWTRRHHRKPRNDDRINQPNFGIQQRPGFFPSEVTYEFLYPKSLPSTENHKNAKTSLSYASPQDQHSWRQGRHFKDTIKHRRKVRRTDCVKFDPYEQEYNFEHDEEYIVSSSDIIDENERWSIVFDDSDDQFSTSINFPIDYFIPSPSVVNNKSSSNSNETQSNIIIDHKANKYFESSPSTTKITKPATLNEYLLCSISNVNKSDFLSIMQRSNMKISQANISPPIFIQRTNKSLFSIIYTYCQTSSIVNVTVKFTDSSPKISVDPNKITLNELIELISKKLDENSIESKIDSIKNIRLTVDELRGSLPLPTTISKNMVLVQPNSTDKQTALKKENLISNNQNEIEQWFDTITNQYDMFECSICCEVLTFNDAYQLLPCHHTLCHLCLTSYIRTSISTATYSSSNTSPIICFQPNCSTQLNSVLLQAFISYDIFSSYNQTLIERHLFSSGHYRQCPSRICSNLLIVDDNNKNPSLMCSCGQRVCSMCLQEYHFPATCKQYKTYEIRLRQSSDHLLSISKFGDNSNCYIAEGKNCPSCGEFVEKNGGCPHMTCKCGNEYCWACLKRWSTHNFSTCYNIPESTHELRSSTRSRFYNKALNHRRQRNQHTFNLLESNIQKSKISREHLGSILSTYIDLNTLAEFIYVLMQRRRINGNIRAVLGQTANRLEADAFRIRVEVEDKRFQKDHIDQIRLRLERTFLNLLYMKETKVLL